MLDHDDDDDDDQRTQTLPDNLLSLDAITEQKAKGTDGRSQFSIEPIKQTCLQLQKQK